jgi:uncharacterized protein YjbJ (UPF0337 family)
MGRIFLFIIIFIIAGVIAMVKSALGKATGNESLKSTTLKGETKKVMDKTARGVNWMEDQWEQSKTDAENSNPRIPRDD